MVSVMMMRLGLLGRGLDRENDVDGWCTYKEGCQCGGGRDRHRRRADPHAGAHGHHEEGLAGIVEVGIGHGVDLIRERGQGADVGDDGHDFGDGRDEAAEAPDRDDRALREVNFVAARGHRTKNVGRSCGWQERDGAPTLHGARQGHAAAARMATHQCVVCYVLCFVLWGGPQKLSKKFLDGRVIYNAGLWIDVVRVRGQEVLLLVKGITGDRIIVVDMRGHPLREWSVHHDGAVVLLRWEGQGVLVWTTPDGEMRQQLDLRRRADFPQIACGGDNGDVFCVSGLDLLRISACPPKRAGWALFFASEWLLWGSWRLGSLFGHPANKTTPEID
jgi:hypothetical protein